MATILPFDSDKHPRGWGGRFSSGPGETGNAHAMRTNHGRPGPHPLKKLHAVTPVIRRVGTPGMPTVRQGFKPIGGD